jgi:hypothetical protein
MDLVVWRVKKNECPRCGNMGIYFNSKREEVNVFGLIKIRTTVTYQCLNHHEQELFAVINERIVK